MAVPKRRLSRANTHSRRSQWKADNVALQETKIDGRPVALPRRLVKAAKLGLIDLDRLAPAIDDALDGGLTINEIKEAFSQLYAYTGFPRSLNALGVLSKCFSSQRRYPLDMFYFSIAER